SQERMVLAVPPGKLSELKKLCASEDVEAAVLGTFEPTGRLRLRYHGNAVADLDMHFLHEGRPTVVRSAGYTGHSQKTAPAGGQSPITNHQSALLAILASPSVCSKEWVIRQYDHEVQSGSVVKPLVGVTNDGPSDAAVVKPVLTSWTGFAVGCGI